MFSSFLLGAIKSDPSFSAIHWLSWYKTSKVIANNIGFKILFLKQLYYNTLVGFKGHFWSFPWFGHERISSWHWQKKSSTRCPLFHKVLIIFHKDCLTLVCIKVTVYFLLTCRACSFFFSLRFHWPEKAAS